MNSNSQWEGVNSLEKVRQEISDLRAAVLKINLENELLFEHYTAMLKSRNEERAALLKYQIPWEYNQRVQSLLKPE